MSWQQYVDEHLMVDLPHGGRLASAAIVGQVSARRGKKRAPLLSLNPHLRHIISRISFLSSSSLLSQDGGIWASSPDFPDVTPEEVDAVVAGLADQSTIATTGLVLAGVKYLVIPGDPGVVLRGKKGADGVTVKKTATALVVGFYGAGAQPGDATGCVEALGDYLLAQGI